MIVFAIFFLRSKKGGAKMMRGWPVVDRAGAPFTQGVYPASAAD